MGVRRDIWSAVKTALDSASLTTSDVSSSSIPVTIKGEYNDSTDKRSLPVITISKVNNPTSGVIFFNSDGFNSSTEPRVMIDIFGKKVIHVEDLSDKITNYFKNNKIGYSLIGIDEDDELTTPNLNKAHHKTLFLTFTYIDR